MYSYYRPRYAAKKPQMKPVQLATVLGSEVMWAVAAYADRVNGGVYVKDEVRNEQGEVTQTRNRDIIRDEVLSGLANVTEADFELGREARAWHRGRLVMKSLKGQVITDFERSLQDVVQQEEFSNRTDALAIAIVASQIASYHRGLAAEQMVASVDTSPLAAVGTKVSVDAVVVRSVYSQNYNVYFVTARTQCNRLVFFSYREGLDANTPIRVRGTVKAHRPDSTQLSRVKLV
jgi:hypothetical protein